MNRHDILNIKLGAKQIPLFFEKNPEEIDPSVRSCILDFARRFGAVDIRSFMAYAQGIIPDLNGGEILQSLFRMASDQTIGFSSMGRDISPFEAKKRLLESPEEDVSVIFNQDVEPDVLAAVRTFFQELTAEVVSSDPHDLSRHVLKQIRYWQDCLGSCKKGSERQRFPGRKAVSGGLKLIDTLLARLDPYSLIHAAYDHRKEMLQLSEDAKTLYEFYLKHENTWETLLMAWDEFSPDAEDIRRTPDMVVDFENLGAILLSERPYHQVEEALGLVDRIFPCHEDIVKNKTARCRGEAGEQIDGFIEGISTTPIAGKTGMELRRITLQKLRILAKRIVVADNITAIREAVDEAEDRFEAFQEEIRTISS